MAVGTDDYIKLLKQEGDFQSSGRFSLEAKKALEKMQEFRLHDPAEYILQLVSCAVMRGATQIQIEINGRDTRVGFDGEAFSAHELEQIFDCASQHSQHPLTAAGAHLAIALQAMQTYNPDVLIVESRDGTGRNVLQLYEQEVWIETLPGSGPHSKKLVTYVGLERSLNLFTMCMPSLVGAWRAEHNLLRRLAFASPIPVTVNGTPLPFFTGPYTILLEGPGRAPVWAKNRPLERTIKHQAWGLAERRRQPFGQVVLVQAGICFPQTSRGVVDGFLVYLQEDRLRRDLSQREIVKNEVRNELVEATQKVLQ